MKVTIRGVEPKLWMRSKHRAMHEEKTMGELVNEGLALREKLIAEARKTKKGKGLTNA